MRKIRYYIFLRDVFLLSISAIGGPQAHIAMFLDLLVKKKNYLTEEELIELNALCQILPGPTSTQTITAIGFRIGGSRLAYFTLFVWALPAVTIMTLAAIGVSTLQTQNISFEFTKYILPMAVGLVALAGYRISEKVVTTKTGLVIMIISAVLSYFMRTQSPYAFPLILIIGGLVTSLKFKRQPKEEKIPLKIQWSNFFVWIGVVLFAAALGGITHALPIRLFENFYRNGSLIFGGGQVLIPLLHSEFVEFKDYLSSTEFLSGYAFVQAIPGPVFSFSAYIGGLAMRDMGVWGQVIGSISAAIGIFLPGTFLIFFLIRFWDGLKKYRVVKASLEGINAASSGMVVAAAIMLFQPIDATLTNILIIASTISLLLFTKVRSFHIILVGLIAGFIF